MRPARLSFLSLATCAVTSTASVAVAAPRTYALIVANNESLDGDLAPLSYADDDAAKYYELFSALGARVDLLAVLDAAAQRRFPAATQASKAPTGAQLRPTLDRMFAEIDEASRAGDETTFYFVFAGHGSLGPNREGYLHLLDGPFARSDLYARVIQRSPAAWNHLIIDACNAYYVVEKRGEGAASEDHTEAVRRFLRSEDLRAYPNTGVILAASSESTTHEWSRWSAGVFSHELRSALLGGADVDADGIVTYAEAAYGVEAANAAISEAGARLRVYARPPPLRVDAPLIDLTGLETTRLELASHLSGHHHVVDARGVRVLDVHPDGDGVRDLALLGAPPFVLVGPRGEHALPDRPLVRIDPGAVVAARIRERGGLEESYRRHLFARPFGPSFLAGALAAQRAGDEGWDGWYGTVIAPTLAVTRAAPEPLPAAYTAALVSFGTAVAAGAASGGLYYAADQSHAAYRRAEAPSQRRALRTRTEAELAAGHGLLGVALAAVVTGGVLVLVEWSSDEDGEAVTVSPAGAGLTLNARF